MAWGVWAWVLVVLGWFVLCGLVTAIIVGIRAVRTLTTELRADREERPERAAPRANLIQWAGREEIRDRVLAHADRKRVTVSDALIAAVERGIDQLEEDSR